MFHPSFPDFTVDLAALNTAQQAYLNKLTEARRHNLSWRSMNQMIQAMTQRLKQQYKTLDQLAYQNQVTGACTQLAVCLHTWAEHQALQDIVQNGTWLNPTLANTKQAFWQRLNSEHAWLGQHLLLSWQEGQQAQANDASRLVQRHVQAADETLEQMTRHTQRVHAQNLDLLHASGQIMRDAQTAVNDANTATRDALTDARLAASETREAASRLLSYAEHAYTESNNLVSTAHQHLQEVLPSCLEDMEERALHRRLNQRGQTFLWICIIIVAILVVCFIGLHFI